MTIKIITKGVDPKTTPLRGTCSNSRTEVECAQVDAKYNGNYDCRDQREQPYYSVVCPVCAHGIYMRKYVPHDGRGPG
jgi:hypothetical protein